MAQAVRRSPPIAGVLSSRLGHAMWISWWTKRGLGRFFRGVSPVFPYHKSHSTISPRSSHPFRFCSSALVMVHQAWSASTLATHGPSSHLIPRPDLVLDTSWGYLNQHNIKWWRGEKWCVLEEDHHRKIPKLTALYQWCKVSSCTQSAGRERVR